VQPKKELLRFVLSPDNEVVLDYNAKLPGRGCYLCLERACLENAVKRNSFRRAFSSDHGLISIDALIETVLNKAKERIASFLFFAMRARKASTGSEAVDIDLKRGNICLLINLPDLAESAMQKWQKRSAKLGIYYLSLDLSGVKRMPGGNLKVLGIKDQGMADAIIRESGVITKLETRSI